MKTFAINSNGMTCVSVLDYADMCGENSARDGIWCLLPSHVAYPSWGEVKFLASDPDLASKCWPLLAPESRKAIIRLAASVQK